MPLSQWLRRRTPRILLVRTDHLGDMLLTLPMASAIKRALPEARVSVLASPVNAEAARHHPDVDEVLTDFCEAKGSGLRNVWPLIRLLRQARFDVAIVVHPTLRLALALWAARVPVRIGTAFRVYSLLWNVRVRQHRRGRREHESALNLELLEPLGIRPQKRGAECKWTTRPEEEIRVAELLRNLAIAPPYVVVHPGSGGSAWNWTPERYANLARRFAAAGYHVLVTGTAREQNLVETVVRGAGQAAWSLAGQLSLGELAVLLRGAALFVGASTGPTHLAATLGTAVVALYSPLRSQLPARWGPIGPRVAVVQPDVNQVCQRCIGAGCPFFFCMDQRLDVERVWAAATRLLGAGDTGGQRAAR